jgi:hypothetical protein
MAELGSEAILELNVGIKISEVLAKRNSVL